MHTKSDNAEISGYDEPNEVIEKLFKSFFFFEISNWISNIDERL